MPWGTRRVGWRGLGWAGPSAAPTPVDFPDLIGWWEAPPSSALNDPSMYVTRIRPAVPDPKAIQNWTLLQVTATANQPDPDGGTSAQMLTDTVGLNTHYAYSGIATDAVVDRTTVLRVRWKPGTRTQMMLSPVTGGDAWIFDTTGLIATIGTLPYISASTTPIGGGWYLCEVKFISTAASMRASVGLAAGGTNAYNGTGTGTGYFYNVEIIQDGYISVWKDLKAAWPGSPYALAPTYDYAQGAAGNRPLVFGPLENQWSNGAPSLGRIASPAAPRQIVLVAPGPLNTILQLPGGKFTVIALVTSTTIPGSYGHFIVGNTNYSPLGFAQSQAPGSVAWTVHYTGAAYKTFNPTAPVTELAVATTLDDPNVRFFMDGAEGLNSPTTIVTTFPLASAPTFTMQMQQNPADAILVFRALALFSRALSQAELQAIELGMRARSM